MHTNAAGGYHNRRGEWTLRIAIFTLFPQMFAGPFDQSIVARARARGIVQIDLHNFRDWATDRHHTVDDYPYGGGAGMVCKCDPLFAAVEGSALPPDAPIVLLSPRGRPFTQRAARHLARHAQLALICGHYEGVDERVREHLATDELSIGDYVLSGGEIAAMVIVDAVIRLLPGVIDETSSSDESHERGLLEYPQYTRPPDFRGWRVPDVLISGNHGAIARWRRQQALRRTWERRPELLGRADLTPEERAVVARWELEAQASPSGDAGG